MAEEKWFLSDEKWAKIEPLLPKLKPGRQGGRPGVANRRVVEGILWILRTGAPWSELPKRYGSPSTCWRRLKRWEEEGVWLKIWREFLSLLDAEGVLDWREAFMDATFIPAKKGAPRSGRLKGGRAQSLWWWSTARVFLWEASWPRPRRRK